MKKSTVKNICKRCGKQKNSLDKYCYCNECRTELTQMWILNNIDHYKAYQKARREELKSQGLCVDCGQHVALEHHQLCENCYFKALGTKLNQRQNWKLLKDKFYEQGCKDPYTGDDLILGLDTSIDHIEPISRNPKRIYDLSNIQFVARSTNCRKNKKNDAEFREWLKRKNNKDAA